MPVNEPSFEIGDSFLLTNENGPHLHVVVAESSPGDGKTIMLVYISSSEIPQKDTTTIINIGEHPFINRKSWVRYQNIGIYSIEEIKPLIVKSFGSISPGLLSRIQDGINGSIYVPKRIKQIYHQWNIDNLYRSI